MEYERRFKFLVCARAFDDDDLEGQRLAQIVDEVARIGYTVIKARKPDDAELVIRVPPAFAPSRDSGRLAPPGMIAAGCGSKVDEMRGLRRSGDFRAA